MNRNSKLTNTLCAVLLGASLFATAAAGQNFEILTFFNLAGVSPRGNLIQGTDGNLYGTIPYGNAGGYGTIFKIDVNGSTFTTLHSFAYSDGAFPYAGLIQGTDGNLYGTTYGGGANGKGTIFKMDTSGSTFTTLHGFAGSDGATPYAGVIQGTDGNLYGTTYYGGANGKGTIFKIDSNGSTFTTLHNFVGSDGAFPLASPIEGTDGNLYGTTYQGGANGYGTIFKMDPNGSVFSTLHSFAGSDGEYPHAGLAQGTDGNLYGTTLNGGAIGYNAGTIFKIDTNGSTFATLHSFGGSGGENPFAGVIQGSDGSLYGTTIVGGANNYGTIFKIDTNGATFTTLHSFVNSDGAYPPAGLIQGTDGNLYGTTRDGGPSNYGTIFKIDTNGSTFTTLHGFAPYSDGVTPDAGLIQATDGDLYGTTYAGSANNLGTIFKIDTNGSTLTTLYSFAGSDGANPQAGLVQGTDGNLYGTTLGGGASNAGTIFKIDTNGSTFATLHSFAGSEGANPSAGLIEGTDGDLYGTTASGGASNDGTIFKIDTNGATLTTLHSFAGSDGAEPFAGLIQGTDGNLYGTTVYGGASNDGTIFKIDTNGATFTTLHSFASSDGVYPYGGLIQGTDGNLYGTTYRGGANVYGTIFKIDTNGSTLTTLYSFAGSDGANPQAALAQVTDGNLYGTTLNGGASGLGTIFKIDTNGTVLTTVHSFNYSDGANPYAGVSQGTDGNLYGTASLGGPAAGGVVFKILSCYFNDVPTSDPFYTYICKIARDGITAGCGGGNYCPDNPVTRAQMAVFLLKAEHGSSYTPPACTAPGIFGDVACPGGFAVDWIEQLYNEGITGGCSSSPLLYCPDQAVTRAQMAVFLLRGEHGPGYTPPTCHGVFGDVPCPGGFAVDWIEQLYAEGVTGGCNGSPLLYCPDNPNTRGQMAVFLVKTFNLP